LIPLERYSPAQLQVAVERGLRSNALIRDAIAQFLIPQEDWGRTGFSLDGREHLRRVALLLRHPQVLLQNLRDALHKRPYPLKLTGVAFALPHQALHLTQMTPVRQVIRLGGVGAF